MIQKFRKLVMNTNLKRISLVSFLEKMITLKINTTDAAAARCFLWITMVKFLCMNSAIFIIPKQCHLWKILDTILINGDSIVAEVSDLSQLIKFLVQEDMHRRFPMSLRS